MEKYQEKKNRCELTELTCGCTQQKKNQKSNKNPTRETILAKVDNSRIRQKKVRMGRHIQEVDL